MKDFRSVKQGAQELRKIKPLWIVENPERISVRYKTEKRRKCRAFMKGKRGVQVAVKNDTLGG